MAGKSFNIYLNNKKSLNLYLIPVKSFNIYIRNKKSLKIYIYSLISFIEKFIFNVTFKFNMAVTSRLRIKLVSDIGAGVYQITFAPHFVYKLVSDIDSSINILFSGRGIYKIFTTVTSQFSGTANIKKTFHPQINFFSTTIGLAVVPTLFEKYTLGHHDPSTLSTMDSQTLDALGRHIL